MKLISFSLYGTDKMYQNGAIENAIDAAKFYPGWLCRFYVSQEIPLSVINRLKAEGVEVVPMIRKKHTDGMLWRFLPISEPLEAVIVRDTDSRFSEREVAAVQAWLESGASFHIMRDHPYHGSPILGGMFGVRGGVIPNIKLKMWLSHIRRILLFRGFFRLKKGDDQRFLEHFIYPKAKRISLIHSEWIKFDDEIIHPFPEPRKDDFYVGSIFHEDGSRIIEYDQLLVTAKFEHLYTRRFLRTRFLKRIIEFIKKSGLLKKLF